MDDAKNRTEDVNRTVNNMKQHCGQYRTGFKCKQDTCLCQEHNNNNKPCYLCKNNFVSYECVTTKNKNKNSV